MQHNSGTGGEGVGAPLYESVNVTDTNVRHLQDRDQCHQNQHERRWRVVTNKSDQCSHRWRSVCVETRAVRSRTPTETTELQS
jgi:hypothetical protein